jgi:hypothetical protein
LADGRERRSALGALRDVSRRIAARIVRVARDAGIGRVIPDDEVDDAVDAMMWWPAYAPYRAAER